MKIVFNTRHPDSPSAAFYRSAFSGLSQISFFDWDHYEDYDVALFMSFKPDIEDLISAKSRCPRIRIGIMDPRGGQIAGCFSHVDFVIADSLEVKDFFARYSLPTLLYTEYPVVQEQRKKHRPKEPVIIGYHGNRAHLAGMYPHITAALEKLAERYSLELWAMYNIENRGRCRIGLPANMPVKHIQWSMENYTEQLSRADIGIVPNLMPIRNISKIKKKAVLWEGFFNDTQDDYLTRYKVPSNPGRIIVFGCLGIPVVADFYPSALQVIQDERNGLLACSSGGWFQALEKLIISAGLRQKLSEGMRDTVAREFDYPVQNRRLAAFCEQILEQPPSRHFADLKLPENMDVGRDVRFGKKALFMRFDRVQKALRRKAGKRMPFR